MALSSPGLTLAIDALFGCIKPQLDLINKLGPTDFSKEAPGVDVKPGATLKVPLSTVSAALAFNDSTNNYLTGGATAYGELTCAHYLQGFDLRGTNLDESGSEARVKQLFSKRAGIGISMAMRNAVRSAIDATTASTGVKIVAAPTLAQYDALAAAVDWLDKTTSTLVANGAEWALIKAALHSANLSVADAAGELGFANVIVVPGMTARSAIVPFSSVGMVGRIPQIIAKYQESGVETDEDSGLSVGIVVADDQKENRIVVNADFWFGVAAISANAAATTAGIIKVGTAT